MNDNWYPPETTYPEGHGPLCVDECEHPCHDIYNQWKARQDRRRLVAL